MAIVGTLPSVLGLALLLILISIILIPLVLIIATLAAMLILGVRHDYSAEELERIMTKSLEPVGLILLETACGGVMRYVLQDSGFGTLIGEGVASASLPIVVVAFAVVALVRISVGSATVAMTMAAGNAGKNCHVLL